MSCALSWQDCSRRLIIPLPASTDRSEARSLPKSRTSSSFPRCLRRENRNAVCSVFSGESRTVVDTSIYSSTRWLMQTHEHEPEMGRIAAETGSSQPKDVGESCRDNGSEA